MTADIVDQPPPRRRPDLTPCWELVIVDLTRHKETLESMFQSQPVRANQNGIIDMVIADMAERDRLGRARYGTPLTAHNGRDQLVDAYQEALDCSVYMRADLEEETDVDMRRHVEAAYELSVANLFSIKSLLVRRDQPKVSS